MTKIILNIEEDKYQTFIEFIKTLDYVTVSDEEYIPQWQVNEVENRLEKLKSQKTSARDWELASKEVFKK